MTIGDTKEWYGVKSLYCCRLKDEGTQRMLVEERIIVVLASSEDEARRRATDEARVYSSSNNFTNETGGRVTTEFLGHCHVTWNGGSVSDCTEVFSRVWFDDSGSTAESLLKEHMGHGQGNDIDPRFVPRRVTGLSP